LTAGEEDIAMPDFEELNWEEAMCSLWQQSRQKAVHKAI
jgi:beta-lactam-binding protein with PASTA domain